MLRTVGRCRFLIGAAVLLGGCALPLVEEGSEAACRITVEEAFDQPVFKPNPLSSGAGPLAGAGMGAVDGLLYGGSGAMFTVPIGAILGAGYGIACALASNELPNAEADFSRLLRAADASLVKRELVAQLTPPSSKCDRLRPEGPLAPGAVIEIEQIEGGMACMQGSNEFWIKVRWRAVSAKDGTVLATMTTARTHTSSRSVREWLTHEDQARAEIEHALAGLGRTIGRQLIGKEGLR